MSVRDFRDLKVWQKAMDLAVAAYRITAAFPDSEKFGLRSQIQRAATFIASNLSEGHALGLPRSFLRHIRIAGGSLAEAETQMILAGRLNYLDGPALNDFLEKVAEIRRMLVGLKRAIETRIRSENPRNSP